MADTGETDVRDRLAEALWRRDNRLNEQAAFLEWSELPWSERGWWLDEAALFMASDLPTVGLRIGRVEE